jgi:hypothetical protein
MSELSCSDLGELDTEGMEILDNGECWRFQECHNVVPMVQSHQGGLEPHPSFGYTCGCGAICCPDKACGERSEKVCDLCCLGGP